MIGEKQSKRRYNLFARLGPGLLVAATGIGAGDLATAAFSGSTLGVAILWAVIVGAFFKFILTEGLTRWQLATASTLLEGASTHLGRPFRFLFLVFLLIWTFMVCAALMSACGVVSQSIMPLSGNPATDKIIYGILLSLLAVLLIRLGGYRLFEKVMSICIGLMFVTVVVTALLLTHDWPVLIKGLLLPSIPQTGNEGLAWTIALIGGVGGTVTILAYGYWIREEGRSGREDLHVSRFDLAFSYFMTAVFGLAMVLIGSTIQVEGQGARLVVKLAARLGQKLGTIGQWTFLIGAFGAVFSSMLGVWQSVPYLFADLWGMMNTRQTPGKTSVDTNSKPYRWYLYGMAVIPMTGLWAGFATMQKFYALVGALFIPLLALVLLVLNGRKKWIGETYRNRPLTSASLVIILLFFLFATWLTIL